MNNERKQEFTLRITGANKTEMIVILYDMFQAYLEDAMTASCGEACQTTDGTDNKESQAANHQISEESPEVAARSEIDQKEFHNAISHARAVLSELIESLNMEYEIAQNLYQIYRYVERLLIQADVRLDAVTLKEASRIIGKLRDAYEVVSKEDTSSPVMENADTVYAGMTYGKTDLQESNLNNSTNRGFLA